jgi:hypothetical protein
MKSVRATMSRMFCCVWAVTAIITRPERRRGREQLRAWHSWQ